MTIQFPVTATLFLILKNPNPAVPVGVKNPIFKALKASLSAQKAASYKSESADY